MFFKNVDGYYSFLETEINVKYALKIYLKVYIY